MTTIRTHACWSKVKPRCVEVTGSGGQERSAECPRVVPITRARPIARARPKLAALGGPLFHSLFSLLFAIFSPHSSTARPTTFFLLSVLPSFANLCLRLGVPWTLNANKSELLHLLSSVSSSSPSPRPLFACWRNRKIQVRLRDMGLTKRRTSPRTPDEFPAAQLFLLGECAPRPHLAVLTTSRKMGS